MYEYRVFVSKEGSKPSAPIVIVCKDDQEAVLAARRLADRTQEVQVFTGKRLVIRMLAHSRA
jgi:hypothetical protein